jgi:hypothetical protein
MEQAIVLAILAVITIFVLYIIEGLFIWYIVYAIHYIQTGDSTHKTQRTAALIFFFILFIYTGVHLRRNIQENQCIINYGGYDCTLFEDFPFPFNYINKFMLEQTLNAKTVEFVYNLCFK